MIKLTEQQLKDKSDFIKNYIVSANAADGSKLDANANVTSKNIATLEAEIPKDINIQINRFMLSEKIETMFSAKLADEYNRQIEEHEIYCHDETSLKPYCLSITLYPFLLDGLTKLGGESEVPKHIDSFCGSFVNLIFAISSQFAGAVASVEWLMYLDYFARKDYGDDYLVTHTEKMKNHLQHVVYAINQPAAARGYQSVFWNISIYDKYYFDAMFKDFVFPDETMSKPTYEHLAPLQEFFMEWFNAERLKNILTFPVVTAAMLTKDDQVRDRTFVKFCAKELNAGNSFFMYLSENADSLSSCCRLKSEISDNTFSYSLGAGGVSTGSINVMTINMNRLVQDKRDLGTEIEKIQKYQLAYRSLMQDYLDHNMLSVYDAGFIDMEKQFLTIGINGMVEAAEYLGYEISNNDAYKNFVSDQLHVIYDLNKKAKREHGHMFNTEFVPAENLGVKNAKWDRKDGYEVKRDCYNSYFYLVEGDATNHLDKIILHGDDMTKYLDGGSALHLNLDDYLSVDAFIKLIDTNAAYGCNYFTTNVKITICNDCEHIEKTTETKCLKCGSTDIDYATRVIGYLKRVSSFSGPRQTEHDIRYYQQLE